MASNLERNAATARRPSQNSRSHPTSALAFDLKDFKGRFSFDDFFNSLVGDLLPYHSDEKNEGDEASPLTSTEQKLSESNFSEFSGFQAAEFVIPLLKEARRELIDLTRQVDSKVTKLKKDVIAQDSEHKMTLSKLERGVDGLFESFGRLDARILGVGQTAARIGDHLQSADAQRETAAQMIEYIKYLIDFNSNRGDLLSFSPPAAVFSDDSRMGEAAIITAKLRNLAIEDVLEDKSSQKGTNASHGLEIAVQNLQEYCNDLENKLLARFDVASLSQDLEAMAECAKILEQFERGSSCIHRYVSTRPMFINIEIMNHDINLVIGESNYGSVANPGRGLTALYKEIIETVREESLTIASVFPSPKSVMKLLVQRIMEQRVTSILDRLMPLPSPDDASWIESGGVITYLRTLAVSYEKTMDLAKELKSIGCGDLDIEGIVDSFFSPHLEVYLEIEQASLMHLFHEKFAEIGNQTLNISSSNESAGYGGHTLTRRLGRSSQLHANSVQNLGSIGFIGECVRWNEEALARCSLFFKEPAPVADKVQYVFGILLNQLSIYSMLGLEKAQQQLEEAYALREQFTISTAVSRRVAAAAAAAAEHAAAAGEQGVRNFMNAVKRSTSNVYIVQQYFVSSVSKFLLPIEGANAKCVDDLAVKMSDADKLTLKCIKTCIDISMAEVERLLQAEQKANDFLPQDDMAIADHRATHACSLVVSYLKRLIEIAMTCLEGPNRKSFLSAVGNRLYKALLVHIQRFTITPTGGLKLKRDVVEYSDFIRSFKSPTVDEKFESLGILVNFFIVPPEGLSTLVEKSHFSQKEALIYIALRADYKSARIANFFAQ